MRIQMLRTLAALLLISLVAAGCGGGGGAPAGAAGQGQGGAAQPQQPARGGTLRYAQPSDINSFDPYDLALGNYPMANQVYSVLARYDENGKPQPELAESWQWSADQKTITFKLRRGVKFHTGREMTADDVVFSLVRARDDDKVLANIKPLAQTVAEAKAVDPLTVSFTFKGPNPAAFDLFDLLYVVDRDTVKDVKAKGVGTGPFKVAEWVPGSQLRLVRNPDYWKPGKPLLDEVVMQVIGDPQALVVNLESGGVDLIERFAIQEYKRLQGNNKMKVGVAAPGSQVFDLLINVKQKPFDDPRVREAIRLSIDGKRFADTILAGTVEPYCLPYPKHSIAFDAEQAGRCKFDLNRARELLAQAGYPNGFETTIMTSTQLNGDHPKLSQILQADFAKIGIRARIEDIEAAAHLARQRNVQFPLATHSYARGAKDPASLFGSARVWFPKGNSSNFSSAEYERLVNEGATTLDEAKRKQIYRQVNEIILKEHFTIPIAPTPRPWAARAQGQGMKWSIDGMVILEDAWLAR